MNKSFNIDRAAEHVKHLYDINGCAVCNKPNGKRMRYPCGHTSCDDCVPPIQSCPFCLTPQDSSSFTAPSIDTPYTRRSVNTYHLLNAFQEEFNVDVNRKQRILEQLRVEKELFPQCIQAPAKYYNKRKSSKSYTENKENNITFFPGEEISSVNKMQNSNSNVREWLNKCVKRKPLGDLNHSRTVNTLHKQPPKVLNTQNIDRSHRKRYHSEIWADENQTVVDYKAPSKKIIKKNTVKKTEIQTNSSIDLQKPKNKDDSGISLDDDVIVIDDSQSVRVDKDMNAWLAVHAEKHACESTTLCSQDFKLSLKTPPVKITKVPFYVKGALSENCEHCNYKQAVNSEQLENQPNISIKVDSESFTAIINVSKADKTIKTCTKQSVEVQTDFKDLGLKFQDLIVEKENENCEDDIIQGDTIPSGSNNEDMFYDCSKDIKNVNKSSNVIIAESDSDEDIEHSTSLQVIADVHRSYDEILVLGDIEDLQEHGKRARRAARGHTPNSTDSSDKENYNPNRKKRSTSFKKKPLKK